jgi:hypothetical protein
VRIDWKGEGIRSSVLEFVAYWDVTWRNGFLPSSLNNCGNRIYILTIPSVLYTLRMILKPTHPVMMRVA